MKQWLHHLYQETGLRSPSELLPKLGFFCLLLWGQVGHIFMGRQLSRAHNTDSSREVEWRSLVNQPLECCLRRCHPFWKSLVPTLLDPSYWHSTIPSTTTWSLSEVEGALGIIYTGGPQRPLKILNLSSCVHNCVCRSLEPASETPSESQWGSKTQTRYTTIICPVSY